MPLSHLKAGDWVYEHSCDPNLPRTVAQQIANIKNGRIFLVGTDIRSYDMDGNGGYERMYITPAPNYPNK